MITRNICPICGSENPEGAEICQVCKANLVALPDDIFQIDNTPVNSPVQQDTETKTPDNGKSESENSPVPIWLQRRFQQKDRQERTPFDFDSYTNALFGGTPENQNPAPSLKITKPQNIRKSDQVYQPFLENVVEPPLLEPDENSPRTIEENVPGITDFNIRRPARKWEDRLPGSPNTANKGTHVNLLHDFSSERPARKWDDESAPENDPLAYDDKGMIQLPDWWKEDAPLVETDPAEPEEKVQEADTPELINSASPTKVADAKRFFNTAGSSSEDDRPTKPRPRSNDYEPESGSLLSELMSEMNSSSGSLTPGERREKENVTVFFSGNHPADDDIPEPEQEIIEIDTSEDNSAGNAAMLDRILRGIGYQVEGEPVPETADHNSIPEKADSPAADEQDENKPDETRPDTVQETVSKPVIHEVYVPQVIENPLVPPEDDEEPGEKDADPYDLGGDGKIPYRDDDGSEDLDIPWDLFGAADMALPQSPEDPAFRTFSRSSIPEEADATAYQQRMISSILGKIIHAENFVEPKTPENKRYISFGARLFWTALAICGVILILTTGIVDHLAPGSVSAGERSQAFYQSVETTEGNALVIMDYTPAYSAHMDDAAERLVSALEDHAEKVYLAALNPAAMPGTQMLLDRHSEKTEFAGWWPAGLISLRSRIAFGNLPQQIWLLTSESSSLQIWAEQLTVSNGKHSLHVLAPEQLSPLLKPYLNSGMVSDALCRDADLLHYGENTYSADRPMMAVWYLSALLPLALLFGALTKFFKTPPSYGRKSSIQPEDLPENPETEAVNG